MTSDDRIVRDLTSVRVGSEVPSTADSSFVAPNSVLVGRVKLE